MQDLRPNDISIIIVSYNTRDYLEDCLRLLCRDRSQLVGEIIVVDNSSADGSVEMLEHGFPEVTLVKNRSNLGYAKAVNQGIRRSRGRYFLVLNPDVEADGASITNLWSFMESNPSVGIAGAKLFYPDGSLQMSCRTFYTLPIVLLRRTFLGKLFPNSRIVRDHLMLDWDHNSERQVDWLIGACLMVRREAYESVGGMDERFFLYLEDVDWCYRMKKHGWQVCYVPSAVMKHEHRRQSARLLPDRRLISHLLSTFRFYDKWNSSLYSLKRERRALAVLGTMATDLALLNLGFVLAYYFRVAIQDLSPKPVYPIATYRGFMIFVNIVCIFALVYSGLYRKPRRTTWVRDLVDISRALLFSSLVIMAATYLTRTIAYSRLVVLVFWPISALLVTTGRAVHRALHRRLRESLFDLRRVAIVGEDQDAITLRDKLVSSPGGGYDFVGYIAPEGKEIREEMKPLIGDTGEVGKQVVEHRINEVFVSDKRLSRMEIGQVVMAARRFGAEVKVVSEVTDILIRGSLLEDIEGVPVVVFPPASLSGTRLITKYVSDYAYAVVGMALLLALAPVVLAYQTLTHRNYSSWIGALQRLLLVLGGKRSLVGPIGSIPGEPVRPGITGVWFTAAGPAADSGKDRMDMYYIQNWSLSFDMEIVLMTLRRVKELFRPCGKSRSVGKGGRV